METQAAIMWEPGGQWADDSDREQDRHGECRQDPEGTVAEESSQVRGPVPASGDDVSADGEEDVQPEGVERNPTDSGRRHDIGEDEAVSDDDGEGGK